MNAPLLAPIFSKGLTIIRRKREIKPKRVNLIRTSIWLGVIFQCNECIKNVFFLLENDRFVCKSTILHHACKNRLNKWQFMFLKTIIPNTKWHDFLRLKLKHFLIQNKI